MIVPRQLGYLSNLGRRVHHMHVVDDAGGVRNVHRHAEYLYAALLLAKDKSVRTSVSEDYAYCMGLKHGDE